MADALRQKALTGSVALVVRQLGGVGLSFCGMLVATRLLGPTSYGGFVIAATLATFIAGVARMGLDVYLVRVQSEPDKREIGTAQGLYVVAALVGGSALVGVGLFGSRWYADEGVRLMIAAQAGILPLMLFSSVPLALLDRALRYRDVAVAELAGQVAFLAVSVPGTFATRSPWALVAGTFLQWVVVFAVAARRSGCGFHPLIDRETARSQLGYGIGYCSAMWLWQLRDLVNPVVVGRLLGPAAVAYVAMAIKLVTMIGFAKGAVWRVYMSFLARVAGDRERMREAVQEGLNHQVLVLAAVFLPFTAVAPEAVGIVMGEKWLPLLTVFPFIAVGAIVNSGFSLHSSSLYIFGHNRDVALFHLVHVLLFVTAATVLLPATATIVGYGYAEVVAFPSYLVLRRALVKRLFSIRERHLYLNTALCSTGIFLLWSMGQALLPVRIGVAVAMCVLTMTLVAPNREVARYWLRRLGMGRPGWEGAA